MQTDFDDSELFFRKQLATLNYDRLNIRQGSRRANLQLTSVGKSVFSPFNN